MGTAKRIKSTGGQAARGTCNSSEDPMNAPHFPRRGHRSALRMHLVWLAQLALLAGCGSGGGGAGPDFAVSPQYKPTGQLSAVAGNKLPVAAAVGDARTCQ